MVCLSREVETLIGQAVGAWRQALECECRGDANAAIAWHRHARDLGERAERLARTSRPTDGRSPAAPPAGPPFPGTGGEIQRRGLTPS